MPESVWARAAMAVVVLVVVVGCGERGEVARAGTDESPEVAQPSAVPERVRLIVDTDANNELDDQHALAYVLLNADTFDLEAITVNATRAGGRIDAHVEEARRVARLCGVEGAVPIHAGADGAFEDIRAEVHEATFDGAEAVRAIVARAHADAAEPLVVLAIGKLTNVALALALDPSIAARMRVVWLGSNYPAPGEYNLENDPPSVQYVLDTPVPFEMVTVRYGEASGTGAIRVTRAEIEAQMPGRGPRVAPVPGRHGGSFTTFGDYAVNLFAHIDYDGDPPARALYDLGAAAILEQPSWGRARQQPAPRLEDGRWVERPANPRVITTWEDFDRDAIVGALYRALDAPVPIGSPKATATTDLTGR